MKRKDTKQIIKEFFLLNPNFRLRVREIERELNLSLPSVIVSVKQLVEDELLQIVKIGNVVFYQANRSNEKYVFEKKLFNLRLLKNSGLIEYLKYNYSNPTIVLFGSFMKGEDIEISDIDIFIETSDKKELNLEKYEIFLKRKIQTFKSKNFLSITNKDLANNIANGIVLNSFLKVIK